MATVQHPTSTSGVDSETQSRALAGEHGKKLSIRERLRIWDEEHQDEAKTILADYADTGELSNSFTRPQNVTMANLEIASPLFDGDELGDLRSEDTNLKPGDMVELRYVCQPLFLLCIETYSTSTVPKALEDRCWQFA